MCISEESFDFSELNEPKFVILFRNKHSPSFAQLWNSIFFCYHAKFIKTTETKHSKIKQVFATPMIFHNIPISLAIDNGCHTDNEATFLAIAWSGNKTYLVFFILTLVTFRFSKR